MHEITQSGGNVTISGPGTYHILTYAWVIGLSAWGGIVGYIRKLKDAEQVKHFSIAELIGEITTSGFVGVLTFWLCESSGMSGLTTAALVGVSGHMGSRAIYGIEMLFKNKLGITNGTSSPYKDKD